MSYFSPVSFREQAEFNEPMYISHSACYRELTSPTNLLSAKYSVLHRRASDPFRYCFCGSNRIKEMQTKANTEIDLKRKLFFPMKMLNRWKIRYPFHSIEWWYKGCWFVLLSAEAVAWVWSRLVNRDIWVYVYSVLNVCKYNQS